MESIDVRFDEELPNKKKSTDCSNPSEYYEEENQGVDEISKTTEDAELSSKSPSRYTQKNHPKDQIIGDKSAGVQTRIQLVE